MSDDFKSWLDANLNFTSRSLGDIASRLNRARKYVPKIESLGVEKAMIELDKNEDFKNLDMCVKSQLKRSVKLYYEYLNSKL